MNAQSKNTFLPAPLWFKTRASLGRTELDRIPPHVRNLKLGTFRQLKAHHFAFEKTKPFDAWAFFATLKEKLESQANAEEGVSILLETPLQ